MDDKDKLKDPPKITKVISRFLKNNHPIFPGNEMGNEITNKKMDREVGFLGGWGEGGEGERGKGKGEVEGERGGGKGKWRGKGKGVRTRKMNSPSALWRSKEAAFTLRECPHPLARRWFVPQSYEGGH